MAFLPDPSHGRPACDHAAAAADPRETAKFAALAGEWWDPKGSFGALHKLNPVRLRFVRDRSAWRFGGDPLGELPLAGLRFLDIGCGGGLLAEPLARLGGRVTGIDAVERNLTTARLHAAANGLSIDYRQATPEALAWPAPGSAPGLPGPAVEPFDVVLAMEVLEHVPDRASFLAACARLLAPHGILFAATLNRTLKAFALAIVGAEYVLGWLPRGTHDWRRFIRPSELAAGLRRQGLDILEITGVTYDVVTDSWGLGRDLDVNYMLVAARG